jgi:hypothetical protein
MYEDDEGRIAAAEQLAEHDPQAAAGWLDLESQLALVQSRDAGQP